MCPQRFELRHPAGEVRIAVGEVPNCGQRAGEGGLWRYRCCWRGGDVGEWGCRRALGPGLLDRGQQAIPGRRFQNPEQIERGDRREQALALDIGDADRQQARGIGRALGERHRPFVLTELGREVGFRQDCDGALAALQRVLHVGDEVVAEVKIPRLDQHRVLGVFQHPGDPLRPGLIGAGVADEEVLLNPAVRGHPRPRLIAATLRRKRGMRQRRRPPPPAPNVDGRPPPAMTGREEGAAHSSYRHTRARIPLLVIRGLVPRINCLGQHTPTTQHVDGMPSPAMTGEGSGGAAAAMTG